MREGWRVREWERDRETERERGGEFCLRVGGREGPGGAPGQAGGYHWRAHAGLAGFCATLAASLDARGPPRRC